jgi:hypothetical protein
VQVVLVAVHADGEDAFVLRDLQNAEAGAAGGGIDDVRALAIWPRVSSPPRTGSFQAAGVVPVMLAITVASGFTATTPWA